MQHKILTGEVRFTSDGRFISAEEQMQIFREERETQEQEEEP